MGLIPGLILNIYKSARMLTSKHISSSLYNDSFPDIKQYFCMVILHCLSVNPSKTETIRLSCLSELMRTIGFPANMFMFKIKSESNQV